VQSLAEVEDPLGEARLDPDPVVGDGELPLPLARPSPDGDLGPRFTERVFDFGQRLHTDDAIPGSGIGLTVCKTVVERHGGRIWVEPSGAGGSRFHFTLPAPPG